MRWECEKTSCENCNILTKGICNTNAKKFWQITTQLKKLKKDVRQTKRTLEKWEDLVVILQKVRQEMKNNESNI